MARMQSAMGSLGTMAPSFALRDVVSGRTLTRDDVRMLASGEGASAGANLPSANTAKQGLTEAEPRGLLLMFVCVHCPFVQHVERELARLGVDYQNRIAIAAISANDVAQYPEDGPEAMKAQAERLGWRFPYLFDETQEVARAYQAACTPDFFLYDTALKLAYRGQLDGSRPMRPSGGGNQLAVTGDDLRRAMEAVLRGQMPDPDQRAGLGCNIKWKESQDRG